MRILVVEDDAALADLTKALLKNWGFESQHCTRGTDAVRMLITKPYDLVLMEVLLPDMKGEELISRLKEISPKIWIVAMTRKNSREMEVRIREQGILYYMVKPFEAENFRSLLEHLRRKSTGIQKRTTEKPSPLKKAYPLKQDNNHGGDNHERYTRYGPSTRS
jgi:DNA-binding response OmpR family regulator